MDNVRNESFLGSDKVIIGNRYTDLVLETLGKVYIKTGNSSKLLNDVLALLDKVEETDIQSNTIIVASQSEMENIEYPGDGFFIFNSLTKSLYIAYDNRYIALIEATESADGGYVRRSGDSMTGQLEINTIAAPLIVASSKLVKNFNAEFINGYTSDELAKKRLDEYIYGNWTFRGKGVSENTWTFKNNVRMYGDLITSRSITSPEFASGFGGYGWRLDADTNTLTIDNLIVRKAMRVYELVINKISATNGSVWISNSSKCDSAIQPIILTSTQLGSIKDWIGSDEQKDLVLSLLSSKYYLPAVNSNVTYVTKSIELSTPSKVTTDNIQFANYKFFISINDSRTLVDSILFKGASTLYNEKLLTSEWETFDNVDKVSEDDYTRFKQSISLYYIGKERKVTSWDTDNTPLTWEYRDTFDRNTYFYIIPYDTYPGSTKLYSELYEDIKTGGMDYTVGIQPFYKYFALRRDVADIAIVQSNRQHAQGLRNTIPVPNLWIIDTDRSEFPALKPGDIIRCQKYSNGGIKYYDALIMSQVNARTFIVMKATSVFDQYTEIMYNEDGSADDYSVVYNNSLYSKTEKSYNPTTGTDEPVSGPISVEARLDDIAKDDDMIQIGNIYDSQRQNSLYLTATDDHGPFIDVISGLNRPDYSVIYDTPIFRRMEYVNTEIDNGYQYVKYNYYIQDKSVTANDSVPIYDKNQKLIYNGTVFPNLNTLLQESKGKWGHSYSKTTRVRIGNLSGIYNETFGNKQPYGFGLYGENVFLTGEFYLNNGQSVVNFSRDGIFLKYERAGLSLTDQFDAEGNPLYLTDSEGNIIYEDGAPIQKQVIDLTADTINLTADGSIHLSADKTFIGKDNSNTVFTVVDGKPMITTSLIKVDEIANYEYVATLLPPTETGSTIYSGDTVLSDMAADLVSNIIYVNPLDVRQDNKWVITGKHHMKDILEAGQNADYNILADSLLIICAPENDPVLISRLFRNTYEDPYIRCDINVLVFKNTDSDVPSIWRLYNGDNVSEYVETEVIIKSDPIYVEYILKHSIDIPSHYKSFFITFSFTGKATPEGNLGIRFGPEIDIVRGIPSRPGEPTKITYWELLKDGSGNLGKGNFSWTSEGDITLTGTFQTTNKDNKVMKMYFSETFQNPTFEFLFNDYPVIKMSYNTFKTTTGESFGSSYISLGGSDKALLELNDRNVQISKILNDTPERLNMGADHIFVGDTMTDPNIMQIYKNLIRIGPEELIVFDNIIPYVVDYYPTRTDINKYEITIGSEFGQWRDDTGKIHEGYEGFSEEGKTLKLNGNPFNLPVGDQNFREVILYSTYLNRTGVHRRVRSAYAIALVVLGTGGQMIHTQIKTLTTWASVTN